jgi:hypothetical protein
MIEKRMLPCIRYAGLAPVCRANLLGGRRMGRDPCWLTVICKRDFMNGIHSVHVSGQPAKAARV